MGCTVAVLGAGNMGTALAQVVASNGHRVRLWSIETDVLEEIRDRRLNSRYLPDVPLHDRIEPKWGLEEALSAAWLAIVSVPSHVVRVVARDAAPFLKTEQAVLNVAKGLEEGSHYRMSQVLAQELPDHLHHSIATMGGPAIAAELAQGLPTAVVVAAPDIAVAAAVRKILENDPFKVQTTTDLCGVEIGATLKNVYAIALGMCDGLGLGVNAKAIVATAAIKEMDAVASALGAEQGSVFGLAGLGDLLTTGYSPHSRNRTLGEKLGSDPSWPRFVETHTVEGVAAARAVRELTKEVRLKAPLLDALYAILHEGAEPGQRFRAFLRSLDFSG
ncbi:MAG: NAD(P)H-dependent glycerol-3-phosphate dehydrogenase [Chloroflexi bacterium]|nr:NAD(P)H-dependent glycerol-3-phosphate dehydrogenase [Chloroflexota bacterium]